MPTLLQIDSCLNMLSTGRIAEEIGRLAINRGWSVYIVHGARFVGEGTCMNSIQSGSKIGEYAHFTESLLLDNHGLASRNSTRRVVEQIKDIRPDVVQIHCAHGYYLNYKILFDYLNSVGIPVVWTFHDCWAFTGHCAHFVTSNCNKWKDGGCYDCPRTKEYPMSLVDRSKRNYTLKKSLFSRCNNLYIVAVSDWLASLTRDSFLGDKDIRTINNGIDLNAFIPCSAKDDRIFKIIAVASTWNAEKGLYDLFKLRDYLPVDQYKITIVGLTNKQIERLPLGIKGLTRTTSVKELAMLYSGSNVLVNPSYADSFPTVNIESIACGTPVITYKTGGSPEIIDEKTGIVVEQGDIYGLVKAIRQLKNNPLLSEDCRNRALREYDKDKRFMDYINLYESII